LKANKRQIKNLPFFVSTRDEPPLLRENSLQYAVAILKVLARMEPGMDVGEIPDVNGDARVGLAEAVHRLQKAAGLR
jgi:hypothetical protein